MSTNPEPMTEKRLGDLMAIARLWPEGLKVRVDDAHMQGVQAVRALADAVPDLVAEIRRLRQCKQEDWCPGVPVACQKHVDQSAYALKAAQDLLLERARENAELLAHVDELRRGMALIQTARTMGGCSTGEAMSKSEYWARLALERTGKESAELIRARHEVVQAAKAWNIAEGEVAQLETDLLLAQAVIELEDLESPSTQANETKKTGQENEGGNA